MNYFLCLFILLPLAGFAQTEKDYLRIMEQYVKFYNLQQEDSLCAMFPAERNENGGCFWKKAQRATNAFDKYGHIQSWRYLGVDKTDAEPVRVFKVVFSKEGHKATSFTLDESRLFGTFRFDTSSEEIERMLKKAK